MYKYWPGAKALGSGCSCLLALTLWGCLASAVVASETESAGSPEMRSPGLTLEQVLSSTLKSSFAIRRSDSRVALGEGRLTAAAATFDPVATVASSWSYEDIPTRADAQAETSLSLTGSRKLRSGITLLPSLSIEQTNSEGPAEPAVSVGTAAMSMVLPLLKDRGGVSSRAAEAAAGLDLEADILGAAHQRQLSLLTSVRLYWSYLAFVEQLEVFRASEERAQRLLQEMRELVAAEQRPASDIDQLTGNLAAKRLDRIAAEQQIVAARQRLGLAMGLPARQVNGLSLPSDPFPEAFPFQPTPASVDRLAALALGRRADLKSLERSVGATGERVRGAESDLSPTLDLTVSVAYSGIESGKAGLDTFVGGLYENVPGPSGSLVMRWRRPARNDAARGALLQQQAFGTEQELLRDELKLTIVTDVHVACSELARQSLRVSDASESVRYRQETVDNEKAKNRLGASTLFDVILAEDNLISALLIEISARQSFADALATLSFQTGSVQLGEPAGSLPDLSPFFSPPELTN